MAETAEPAASTGAVDFSKFATGQEYEGTPLSFKPFGVFVDIGMGINVLLPRSLMTKSSYDKLTKQIEGKSKDKVKLELVTVSAENRTLSGKYVPAGKKARVDLATLAADKVATSATYEATVISTHDFGVFAEISELGLEGLVPNTKLPMKQTKGSAKASFPVGTKLSVKIDNINLETKKVSLTARLESRADVSEFASVDHNKWLQLTVTSVSNFGLFARPAGSDVIGLVHQSRIPRDLIAALKKMAPIATGTNKTDVEALFSAGDVIKARVNIVKPEEKKLELSMLPFRAAEDDDEDFATMNEAEVAEAAAGPVAEAVEGEEGAAPASNFSGRRQRDKDVIDAVDEAEEVTYNALETLVWWRGAPFKPEPRVPAVPKDEELEVLNESRDVVEGTWRRMFELDMREDELDFSSKMMEEEMKELEEEIGELKGLDEELYDTVGAGSIFNTRVGNFISTSALPAEWKEQLEFFKEAESSSTAKNALLKAGKKSEVASFESVVREVESTIERNAVKAATKRGGAGDVSAEAVSAPLDAPAEV